MGWRWGVPPFAKKNYHAIFKPTQKSDRGPYETHIQLHPPPMAGLSIWLFGYHNIQPDVCSNKNSPHSNPVYRGIGS